MRPLRSEDQPADPSVSTPSSGSSICLGGPEPASSIRSVEPSLQAFYNAEKPRFGSDWQLRFQVQFLLPTFK
jgi:hypothetical protein